MPDSFPGARRSFDLAGDKIPLAAQEVGSPPAMTSRREGCASSEGIPESGKRHSGNREFGRRGREPISFLDRARFVPGGEVALLGLQAGGAEDIDFSADLLARTAWYACGSDFPSYLFAT